MSTPEKLGKYQIVRVIGKGAMGIVYEGFDPLIERTVAIKTIRMDDLDEEEAEEHSRRFKVEARAAGKLNHPNIVAIYDYGEEQNLAYIVMEYVQGRELKSYFESGYRFPLSQAVRIMVQLLDALGYSHVRGVIHRDIKPANLFITENNTVKLGDFGIARIDSTHKTHAGTVLGTPSYMSPEQIKGESVDNRSDLYSCGVILYQFLTGEKPFSGSMVAVMHKVLTVEPTPPSTQNPQVSPQLDQIIARAMAKQPEDRYANAREFSEALRAVIQPAAADNDDADATRVITLRKDRAVPPADEPSLGTASLAENEIEIEFWRSIKDGSDAENFILYLKKYPQGHYTELAQLKLDKLHHTETTLTHSATDDTAARTGTNRIEDIRRRAEEARRRAEEEMRRADEELQRAEAAQQQAEEEARQKTNAAVAETASLADAAAQFSQAVDIALRHGTQKQAKDALRQQAGMLLQRAAMLQSSLLDLQKTPDVLPDDALQQAEAARNDCGTAEKLTQASLQRFETAFGELVEALHHQVDTIAQTGRAASQALADTERLAQVAVNIGASTKAVEEVREAARQLCDITAEARNRIQAVLHDRDLLRPEALAIVEAAESACALAETRAADAVGKSEAALRLAEEARQKAEAQRLAEEDARLKAEADARRQADEEAKRRAAEIEVERVAAEAKRRAEDEARLQAEADAAARAKAEAERRQAEDEAKRQAIEAERVAAEAKRQAEADARQKAEEEARQKAEIEAEREAAEARRRADDETRLQAENEAKRQAIEAERIAAEAKRQAEADARQKAEEEARQKAEIEAKRQADEKARIPPAPPERTLPGSDADSDATVLRRSGFTVPQSEAPATPVSPVSPAPTPAPAPAPAGRLPIIPLAIGGVVIAGVIGWVLSRSPSAPEAPLPPALPSIAPAPVAPPPVGTQTQQSKAASQAATEAQQRADEQLRKLAEAQKSAEEARRNAEKASRMGDTQQANAAKQKAEAEIRRAEEAQRKAEDEARKANAEAQRKAAEAEAQRKATEAEAQRKAAEAEVQRKAAEAEVQRKSDSGEQPKSSLAELYQQAQSLESDGRGAEAVRLYKRAANAGHGPSSKRLGELYLKGMKGVAKDYAESVRWYDKAGQQGMNIQK